MSDGTEITMLNEMWDNTDSGVITENVVKLLTEDGYNTFTERWKRLMDITETES